MLLSCESMLWYRQTPMVQYNSTNIERVLKFLYPPIGLAVFTDNHPYKLQNSKSSPRETPSFVVLEPK